MEDVTAHKALGSVDQRPSFMQILIGNLKERMENLCNFIQMKPVIQAVVVIVVNFWSTNSIQLPLQSLHLLDHLLRLSIILNLSTQVH